MAATSTSDPGRDHLRRIAVIWAVASIVGVILVVFLLGPHMPPGRDTAVASDQTTANIILSAICTPILLGIWVYFIYAIAVFRRRPADAGDGPPDHGSSRVQLIWLARGWAVPAGPARGARTSCMLFQRCGCDDSQPLHENGSFYNRSGSRVNSSWDRPTPRSA